MILVGDKIIISPQIPLTLLVLAVTAVATVFYLRLRWLRRADRVVPRSVRDLPVGVEISYAEFDAMKDDLEPGPMGDGLDSAGRPFTIIRYRSRETGKLYDYTYGAAGPRVIQYPARSNSDEGVTRLGDRDACIVASHTDRRPSP
jgi:hypothetical protein